jgi:hypothetical protein
MKGRLTELERREIAKRLLAGESPTALSREYGVSRPYLSRVKSALRNRDDRRGKPAVFDYQTAKDELRRKAYPAVTAGLDCADDPYKRANVGVQVLKGTGDLFGDTNVNVGIQLNNCPAELLERMLATPDGDIPPAASGRYIETPAD